MAKCFATASFVTILAVSACSEPEPTAPAEPAATNTAAPASSNKGVIPHAQLDAMAKAAATGSVLEQAEQERRKQMEAQGL